MHVLVLLALLGVSASSLMAGRVVWTAKGKVTEVTGVGLQALVAADEVVDVTFSYDDLAVGIAREGFSPAFQTFDFRQNVQLEIEVSIGGLTWAGSLASGTSGEPLTLQITDVETLFGTIEQVSPTLSSKFGEVFSSFPGASATGDNELRITYEDRQDLFDAVQGLAFIPVTNPPAEVGIGAVSITACEFTSGSGEIRAGSDTISYLIDVATLHIGDGSPPPTPMMIDLAIALVGPEVQLSWDATPDKCYRVQSSTDLENWENVTGIVAQSASGSYSVFLSGAPAAQYYRVLQLD